MTFWFFVRYLGDRRRRPREERQPSIAKAVECGELVRLRFLDPFGPELHEHDPSRADRQMSTTTNNNDECRVHRKKTSLGRCFSLPFMLDRATRRSRLVDV